MSNGWQDPQFEKGLSIRNQVLGEEYVRRSFTQADAFTQPLQELTTRYAWGSIWSRPQLDRKTRSLINIATLAAMGKSNELRLHVHGALRNGCSQEEIREALLHAAVYAGIPAAAEGFRVAAEAIAGFHG